MAVGPEHPFFWKLVEWGGYMAGVVATAFGSFAFKRYRSDRKRLFTLEREVHDVKVLLTTHSAALGQIPEMKSEMDEMDGEIKQIKRNQVEQKRLQHEMRAKQVEILQSLSRMDANIEWLCGKHGKHSGGS